MASDEDDEHDEQETMFGGSPPTEIPVSQPADDDGNDAVGVGTPHCDSICPTCKGKCNRPSHNTGSHFCNVCKTSW
jgi:hypothetical protein